jgi:hypothetical protein
MQNNLSEPPEEEFGSTYCRTQRHETLSVTERKRAFKVLYSVQDDESV